MKTMTAVALFAACSSVAVIADEAALTQDLQLMVSAQMQTLNKAVSEQAKLAIQTSIIQIQQHQHLHSENQRLVKSRSVHGTYQQQAE